MRHLAARDALSDSPAHYRSFRYAFAPRFVPRAAFRIPQ